MRNHLAFELLADALDSLGVDVQTRGENHVGMRHLVVGDKTKLATLITIQRQGGFVEIVIKEFRPNQSRELTFQLPRKPK